MSRKNRPVDFVPSAVFSTPLIDYFENRSFSGVLILAVNWTHYRERVQCWAASGRNPRMMTTSRNSTSGPGRTWGFFGIGSECGLNLTKTDQINGVNLVTFFTSQDRSDLDIFCCIFHILYLINLPIWTSYCCLHDPVISFPSLRYYEGELLYQNEATMVVWTGVFTGR